ncbi:hypothetical protein [Streptomyces sp. NPDC006785]|uniref:hypothetical protein n=1 Tax=Streptomyces sp. NPDC006785 TaxID=3155461 RepID=UPI0033DEDB69
MTDVVYVVGPGDANEELRYSLRSLAAHFPHEKVWIAGHRPSWVSDTVGHIPASQARSRFQNSTGNMRAACEHPEVAEEFVYFNDDFFVMEPVDGAPVVHRGTVDEVAAVTRSSLYRRGGQATQLLMKRLGLADNGPLLSYEVHAPMTLGKARMLEVLAKGAGLPVLHKRSLYGNYWRLGGEQITDVKVQNRDDGLPPGPFASTSDDAFTHGRIGELIREAFPDPCRYEAGHEDTAPQEPAQGPSARPEEPVADRPATRAPVAEWRAWADSQDTGDHSSMTKAELIEQYGG